MNQPILLLLDDEERRAAVLDNLSLRGYFVLFASNLDEAYDAISAGIYQVAIVGRWFCNVDGRRLVSKLKQVGPETRVVMVARGKAADVPAGFCENHRIDRLLDDRYEVADISDVAAKLAGEATSMTVIPGSASRIETEPPRSFHSRSVAPASIQNYVTIAPSEPFLTEPSGNDELDPETERHLLELSREYQKKLPEELAQLKEALRAAKENPEDEDIIMEIRQNTHTICGTSGTLGFMEVSEIVRQINNKIKVIEQAGRGTNDQWETLFYLIDRAISTPERSSLVPVEIAAAGQVATVLVVGQDRSQLMGLRSMGEHNMVNVLVAATRMEALTQVSDGSADGVIIDLDVTAFDPVELAHEIRGQEGQQELPVAFLSCENTVEKRVAAASAGAVQFVQKPIGEGQLLELAREFSSVASATSARVLIVDDDQFFRRHICNILESAHLEVRELADPKRVLDTLDEQVPDILLLDVQMPRVSGWDVCRMVRSVPKWRNLPILFLTGESDTRARIECFRAGGDDYIQKPCVREELLARINVRLERIRLFKERADKDPLTQLFNRRAFLEQVEQRLDEGRRFDRPLSLCIIDLDKFKNVNDTHGHLAGDRVLAATGKLLLSRFRQVDVRGRWGGEEFAVVFYNEGAETAKQLLYEALKSLRKLVFTGDEGETFQVTFSSGVATMPTDATDFDTLFKIADSNLYVAKEDGRNRIYTSQDAAKADVAGPP